MRRALLVTAVLTGALLGCSGGLGNTIQGDINVKTDATLSALTMSLWDGSSYSAGAFTPAFASLTTSYTVNVGNTVTSASVRPTASQAETRIEARVEAGAWATVPSADTSAALPLNSGDTNTSIDIRVTAQDGTTQMTYEITVAKSVPGAPAGLTAGSATLTGLTASWSASVGATSYQVYRDTSAGVTAGSKKAYDGASLSFQDSGLSNNTIYYYAARATNSYGSSPLSSVVSCETARPYAEITIHSAGDSFIMGDDQAYTAQKLQTISYDFMMSKYAITNYLYKLFMDDNGYTTQSYWTNNGWVWKTDRSITQPDYWTDADFNTANQPVVGVSWYEAVAYCNWRSVKEGLTKAYDIAGKATLSATGYRLPTEVEFEYAAAKGASNQSERIYPWGDTWDLSKVVSSVTPPTPAKTAKVGSRSPVGDTPQGLADMSGNASVWISDNWQIFWKITQETNRYYFNDDATTTDFVYRGGNWHDWTQELFRSASINIYINLQPDMRDSGIGFRVVHP